MGEKSTAISPGAPCSLVAVGALLSGEETKAQGLLRKPWGKWNLMPIYSKSQEGHTRLRTRSLPLGPPVTGPNLPEASLPAPTVRLVIWSNPRNSRTASHHLLLSLCRCRSFCPEHPSVLPHPMGSTWPSHNTSSEKHSVLTPCPICGGAGDPPVTSRPGRVTFQGRRLAPHRCSAQACRVKMGGFAGPPAFVCLMSRGAQRKDPALTLGGDRGRSVPRSEEEESLPAGPPELSACSQ